MLLFLNVLLFFATCPSSRRSCLKRDYALRYGQNGEDTGQNDALPLVRTFLYSSGNNAVTGKAADQSEIGIDAWIVGTRRAAAPDGFAVFRDLHLVRDE